MIGVGELVFTFEGAGVTPVKIVVGPSVVTDEGDGLVGIEGTGVASNWPVGTLVPVGPLDIELVVAYVDPEVGASVAVVGSESVVDVGELVSEVGPLVIELVVAYVDSMVGDEVPV